MNQLCRTSVAVLFYSLLFFTDPLAAGPSSEVRMGTVTRVVDGDTVWVNSDDILLKVRILGIDAPEICQSHGPEAREALKAKALGQMVTIAYQHVDEYGRLLSRVDLKGEDLGRWMVSRGYAWSYGYRNYPGPYALEENASRNARAGIFSLAAPETPRHFRKRHGSCFP